MAIGLSILIWLFQQTQPSGVVEVNAVVCEDVNRSFIIACLAIDVAVVVVCLVLKWLWDRRLVWTYGVRLAIPLVLAVIISSALIAWEPVKDEVLLACRESEEYSRYVIMSHVAAIPRGLVLGGLVSAALYFLILVILGLFTKRKKS